MTTVEIQEKILETNEYNYEYLISQHKISTYVYSQQNIFEIDIKTLFLYKS